MKTLTIEHLQSIVAEHFLSLSFYKIFQWNSIKKKGLKHKMILLIQKMRQIFLKKFNINIAYIKYKKRFHKNDYNMIIIKNQSSNNG